jgi:hypothetical protein
VTRIFIPSGHNIGAQSVVVASDDNGSFTSPTTLATITTAAGLVEAALTSSTERYLRVSIPGSGSAWEYGEMWLGRLRTPTSAVLVDPGWEMPPIHNVTVQRSPSGVQGAVVNGGDQRSLKMTLTWVAGTDLTLFQEMAAACGDGKSPLWVGYPDDAAPTTLMWLASISAWKQDSGVPQATGPTYTVGLELVEALG